MRQERWYVELAELPADITGLPQPSGGKVRHQTMIFLETKRLIFRTLEIKDEADFVRTQKDPAIRRYMGGQAWPPKGAQTRFRNEYLDRPAASLSQTVVIAQWVT